MNRQEAIEVLKEDRYLYESDTTSAGDGTPDGDLLLALDMAISALEKQILKKPIKAKEHIRYLTCYICPNCQGTFSGTGIASYCYHCGQALDWSDKE